MVEWHTHRSKKPFAASSSLALGTKQTGFSDDSSRHLPLKDARFDSWKLHHFTGVKANHRHLISVTTSTIMASLWLILGGPNSQVEGSIPDGAAILCLNTLMYNAIILTDFTDTVFLPRMLGPYKIAHELRKLNVDVTVINHIHMWDFAELIEFVDSLINKKTLFIGINNMYVKNAENVDFYSGKHLTLSAAYKGQILPQGKSASDQFVEFVKSKNIPLVLGGPKSQDRSHNKHFDYLLQGFADTSIASFVEHLKTGAAMLQSYRSVYGPVVVQDTNESTKWDFASSTMQWHDHDVILPNETLTIEIARGCIFKCSFCSFPLIGKKKFDYIRHFDQIKKELIENWERFGVTRYYIGDETFNDSVFKLELMEKLASELPFQLEYFAYLRLDLIIKNPETIGMLYRSGLRATHFGIETFHPTAGKAIGKKFKAEQVISVLKQIKEVSHGQINLHASFIVGLPGETKESIMETYNMLKSQEIPLDSFVYFPLTIFNAGLGKDSLFSKDYKKHGYSELEDSDRKAKYTQTFSECIPWTSSTMDCVDAAELASHLDKTSFDFKRLGGIASLEIAGLGFDPAFYTNKTYNKVDWAAVVQRKISRFEEYKKRLLSFANKSNVQG